MKKQRYIHSEIVHNMNAPTIVVPIVLDVFPNIRSVVDFGCGIGTWLRAFKDCGIDDILALDGEWCDQRLLFKYIRPDEFMSVDLDHPIHLDKTYDLVIALEVAEHLPETSADTFVQSLVNAGKIILFSAAIPGQGGYKHINEQWPAYWVEKFQKHGYKTYDIIRPQIWNSKDVESWYKQNIFLLAHNSIEINANETTVFPLMHPDTFNWINKTLQGKRGVSVYFKLFLKSIINKFRK